VSELYVHTLGDTVDYEPYQRTRKFYRISGFQANRESRKPGVRLRRAPIIGSKRKARSTRFASPASWNDAPSPSKETGVRRWRFRALFYLIDFVARSGAQGRRKALARGVPYYFTCNMAHIALYEIAGSPKEEDQEVEFIELAPSKVLAKQPLTEIKSINNGRHFWIVSPPFSILSCRLNSEVIVMRAGVPLPP
jgi:hypothetical protein